jgi:hypothetical protein
VRGVTDPTNGQVDIGRAALTSRALDRSTLLHEQTHLAQTARGNLSNGTGIASDVNEAEAYRQELLEYQRSGLSPVEQRIIALDYARTLDKIGANPKFGDIYLRRILIDENFELLPQHAFHGSMPDWTAGWVPR